MANKKRMPNHWAIQMDAGKDQAHRIIQKFGGPLKVYEAIKSTSPDYPIWPSTIYRWTYPRSKGGTGGIIPIRSMRMVLKAARMYGVLLTIDDLYPGEKVE